MALARPAVINGIKTFFNLPLDQALPSTVTLYLSFWNTLDITNSIGTLLNISNFTTASNLNSVIFDIIHNQNQKNYVVSNREVLIYSNSTKNGEFRYIGIGISSTVGPTFNGARSVVVLPESIIIPAPTASNENLFRVAAGEIRFKFDYI
jgi:hypothetical protein